MSAAAEIARGLGLKHIGRSWRGACPVHGGNSFTVTEKAGVPLFYCWHGCDRAAILDELRARGLWPERPRPERVPTSPAEKRAWAVRRRRAERMASDAEAWRAAMADELEAAKRGAYEAGRLEDVFTIAREVERIRGLHGAALADAYIAARNGQPEQTVALIGARRRDEQIARRLCGWVVQRIGAEHDANSSVAA